MVSQTLPQARILPPLPAGAPLARRALRTLLRIGQALYVHQALDAAGSMAFNFFLSLIPLLVLLGFVLGQLVRQKGIDALVSPLLEAVPATSSDLVRHELERLAGASTASIAPLSVVTFFWLTASGTHHMMDCFERAVLAPPRGWFKQRAIALASVVFGIVLVSGTAWVLIEIDGLVHGASAESAAPVAAPPPSVSAAPPPPLRGGSGIHGPKEARGLARAERKRILLTRAHAGWEDGVAIFALLAVAVAGLALFYRYAVEHPPGIRRRAWPGAFTGVLSFLVVSWGFGNYVITLGRYAVYYGSLAAVAVLLVWLYLMSLSLLLGAEVNALLEGVRD
jgi:membrane protein